MFNLRLKISNEENYVKAGSRVPVPAASPPPCIRGFRMCRSRETASGSSVTLESMRLRRGEFLAQSLRMSESQGIGRGLL